MLSIRGISSVGFAVFAAACAFTACGSSDSGTGGTGGQAGATGSGGTGGSTLPCSDGGQLDLDGIFALAAKFSFTFSSLPGGAVTVCPADQTSEGSFLGLVKIVHEPGTRELKSVEAVVCTLQLPIISAVVGECTPDSTNMVYAGLEFPQALIDAAPLATLAKTTGVIGATTDGTTFDANRLTFTIGTRKAGDEMPSWLMDKTGCGMSDNAEGRGQGCSTLCVSDCTQMADDDTDGYPGVTINVCGQTKDDLDQKVKCNAEEPNVPGTTLQGRAFMNLQVDPRLSGTASSSCEVSGPLDAAIRYNVDGADLYLMSTQISVTSAIKSLPRYTVNTSESRFRLARIDGKHGSTNWTPNFSEPLASCKTVIAHQNELK